MEDINVFYGPNNAGKSNLLRAIELYFRLLGQGESVTRAQSQTLDRLDARTHELLTRGFNRLDPQPITLQADWSLTQKDLDSAGLHPEQPCHTISTTLEVKLIGRVLELRVQRWVMGDKDISQLDRTKDAPLVGFGQQIRRLLSDARPFQQDQPVLPVLYAGKPSAGCPPALRDALFDARQSLNATQRRRWSLFSDLAGGLKLELGEGHWDTVFDRATGQADLIYIHGNDPRTMEDMGDGVVRMVSLLAELALAQEPWICLEEPEWRLSPEMQRRFATLARRALGSGVGPKQYFVTTHSPTMAACGAAFGMEVDEGIPYLQKRPWLSGEVATATSEEAGPDLGQLIGLVETLAEIDPDELVSEDDISLALPEPAEAAPAA